jgi:hypothetical protein
MKGSNKAAEKAKQTTVIDRSRVADMNMAVLKRIDPHTEEVGLPNLAWSAVRSANMMPGADPCYCWPRMLVQDERGRSAVGRYDVEIIWHGSCSSPSSMCQCAHERLK